MFEVPELNDPRQSGKKIKRKLLHLKVEKPQVRFMNKLRKKRLKSRKKLSAKEHAKLGEYTTTQAAPHRKVEKRSLR